MKTIPKICLAAAIACLGWAAWDVLRPASAAPGLSLSFLEYEFPDPVPVGSPQTFSFTAVNRGSHVVRVVGLGTC